MSCIAMHWSIVVKKVLLFFCFKIPLRKSVETVSMLVQGQVFFYLWDDSEPAPQIMKPDFSDIHTIYHNLASHSFYDAEY